MKEEILKVVARQICEDLSEAIIVGVKEYEEDFPYTIACVNFISELKENGVKVNLRVLLIAKIYLIICIENSVDI